tara:strand:- start:984 stop:1415 length:432 start_codon:yes stop_codon:yes gene_type:complete
MKLKNIYKNKTSFFLLLIIIFILHQNNVLEKTYIISKFTTKERLTKSYGYCEGSGYGFIDDVFNENKISQNIEILNEDYSFNNSIWFKYKVNQPISKEEIILINNQKSIEFIKNKKVRLTYKGKDYGFYRIIKEVENCYYLKK